VKGLEFYSAAATIIPVLVLVFGIEFNLRRLSVYLSRRLRLLAVFLLAFWTLGEARALRVLQAEDAAFYDPWVVWITLGTLAGGILGGVLSNPFAPTRRIGE